MFTALKMRGKVISASTATETQHGIHITLGNKGIFDKLSFIKLKLC